MLRIRQVAALTAVVGMLATPIKVSAEDPQVAYWLHCAGCHGLQGEGAPPEVPTLVNELGRIAAVPGGREYLIRVPGVAQSALSDPELVEVVNFMMTRFNAATLAQDFEPYSVEEIGRYRSMTLEDPLRRRREIWPVHDSQ